MNGETCPMCKGEGVIDIGRLANAIKYKMAMEGLSTRQVAEQTGVTNSTAWRVSRGHQADPATFVKLAEWLKLTPEQAWDMLVAETSASDTGAEEQK